MHTILVQNILVIFYLENGVKETDWLEQRGCERRKEKVAQKREFTFRR
jgi:hypothetical protein